MCKLSILDTHRIELQASLRMKSEGRTQVAANVAGKELAAGREFVPIDEYIDSWSIRILAMEAGAAQEQFNY